MSSKHHAKVGVAIVLLSSGAAMTAVYGAGPMNCDIVRLDTASSIDLVGKISSPVPTEGSYQFIIEKQGPSGRSDIAQSGDFAVSSNESEEVGRVSLDMDPSAFYIAHLIVEWSGGQIDCHYDSRH